MDDATYLVVPILSLASLLITITPFAFVSIKAHPGVALYMMWQALNHLVTAINRVLWLGNARDRSPLWCDTSIRIEVGKSVGIPASILCMIRGIYRVVSMDIVFECQRSKWVFFLQCLFIGIGLPILAAIFVTIISATRYGIVIDHGCVPAANNNWARYLAYGAWPFILSLMTVIYCVLTVIKCRKLRNGRIFASDSRSSVDQHISHRSLICAGITSVTFFPMCSLNIVISLSNGVEPWPGWELTKRNYTTPFVVDSRSSLDYRPYNVERNLVVAEHIVSSVIFFLIFGTGTVAIRSYSRAFWRAGSAFGVTRTSEAVSPEMEMTFAERDLDEQHVPEVIGVPHGDDLVSRVDVPDDQKTTEQQ